MNVWGVTGVKDEADVIEDVIRNMARHVDSIICLDNMSTDGTREILDKLAKELPLWILDDPIIAYTQSAKMTQAAELAAEQGATWIVPFDADEIWHAHEYRIVDVLEACNADLVEVAMLNHVPTAQDELGPPIRTMRWRRPELNPMNKVAVRWAPGTVIAQGNHWAHFSFEPVVEPSMFIEIRHFPYRSAEQFVTKARNGAAAYAASDLPADFGRHWRDYGALLDSEGPEALQDVFRTWFWEIDPVARGLIEDPAPI